MVKRIETYFKDDVRRLFGFHMTWSVIGLFVVYLIGQTFEPTGLLPASIKHLSASDAIIARLPLNSFLWVVLVVVALFYENYARWFTKVAYNGTTPWAIQSKKHDGNDSPSRFQKGYFVGVVLTLAKIALFDPMTTVHLIFVRMFLFNIGVALLAMVLIRRRSGVTSFAEWQTELSTPGTDGPTLEFEKAVWLIGGLGFLMP
jgi:hypothetical protein